MADDKMSVDQMACCLENLDAWLGSFNGTGWINKISVSSLKIILATKTFERPVET
jgi:hypothetical protein